jgi:hypothetical protein
MKEKDTYWLDDPRNVNRLYWGLVVVCILLGVADLFVHRHVHFSWESFPNFFGFFGFAAFWCVVIAGKNLRKILWRPEDYYDD